MVTDVFSTELGIRLSFVKTSEFRGGGVLNPPKYSLSVHHCSHVQPDDGHHEGPKHVVAS
jgi:hypothetical protein